MRDEARFRRGARAALTGGGHRKIQGTVPLVPGGVVLLVGPNGAGKSLSLGCIAALTGMADLGFVHEVTDGHLVGSGPWDASAVRQEPLENFFSRIAADEFMLPLLRPGIAKEERRQRLERILSHIGADTELLSEKLSHLSSGTIQYLALLVALVSEPRLLLLDEPFSRMDFRRRSRAVKALLAHCQTAGATAVIATHEAAGLLPLFSKATHLCVMTVSSKNGHVRLRENATQALNQGSALSEAAETLEVRSITPATEPSSRWTPFARGSLEMSGGRSKKTIAERREIALRRGINIIVGPNGSGKTTLGRLLAGQIPIEPWFKGRRQIYARGEFVLSDGRSLSAVAKAGESVFLPSDPDYWLAHDTARNELSSLQTLEAAGESEAVAEQLNIPLDKPIEELSYGQRKCVAILSVPPGLSLVVLDEPMADLSPDVRATIGSWISKRVFSHDWTCVAIATNRESSARHFLGEGDGPDR